jgi:hypothetical protein
LDDFPVERRDVMSPKRRLFNAVGLALLVGTTLAATAATASGTATLSKPVIGKAVTAPAQAVAGKRFTVSVRVTDASGAALTRGKMICDPSVAGQVIRHSESFASGTARVSFIVPASAAGKVLKLKLTIKAGMQSSRKVFTFRVQASAKPAISMADASVLEGNTGTTTLSFPVTLSASATQAVSVSYATSDGSASAPADYAAATGTLTFQAGQRTQMVSVGVVGDLNIEPSETFTVVLSNPVGAAIARGTATGTIQNDDTAVPVTPGSYKGTTQEGNSLFFTVLANRTVTSFRGNAFAETCDPPWIEIYGRFNYGDSVFPIWADGSFVAEYSWTGSDWSGGVEWTGEYSKLAGLFNTSTTANGTIIIKHELNYSGQHFTCSSGEVKWTAALQG